MWSAVRPENARYSSATRSTGKDAAGGAVLRRHVGDGGAIGERQARESGSEELDELAHHALHAQHLGHGQHEIGGGRALAQPAGQPEADHLRDEHGHRLAEHRGLGLDAADAPAQDTQAVDHRGVGIGADQGVGISHREIAVLVHHHHPRQILEIDLMDDAGVGRHDAEVAEGALAPAQEGVALAVALELALGVDQESGARAVLVDLHRVVDDQLDRLQGVDAARISAHGAHGIAHRGEIDHRRHAGEVLQEDAPRHERDLLGRRRFRIPRGQRLDVFRAHHATILATQQILEQDAQRVRQTTEMEAAALERRQAIDSDLATARDERAATCKSVSHRVLPSPRNSKNNQDTAPGGHC